MRVTNNMMLRTTKANINGNKQNVNTLSNQMSSQKKISRPSEDPVVAIRALRFRSNLSEINQYYKNNIPDAGAWLEITETALENMEDILENVRTQCVYGATSTLGVDERNAILTDLTKLREQLYAEGNTDYAGRTIFTGFRTNSKLTFQTEEPDTTYDITQTFTELDIEKEHRYYKGEAQVPTDDQLTNNAAPGELERTECDRIRFAYDNLTTEEVTDPTTNTTTTQITGLNLQFTDGTVTNGQLQYTNLDDMTTLDGTDVTITTYATIQEWKNASADFPNAVDDNEVVVIAETGEMLLGKGVSTAIESNNYSLSVSYSKTGFAKGELRPEYYFNCTDTTDPDVNNHVEYVKYDEAGKEIPQDINYTVAHNQTLTVNTNASDVFNEDAGRDVDEMIDAVKYAIDAHDKVARIKEMKGLEKYASAEDQAKLQEWQDAAQKEADYADDNLKKLYNTYIGKFDSYLKDVNLAITTVGSKGSQLELTEIRMSNQQLSVTDLMSENENKELSDVIIDYTSAYYAYQGSLQAASKINQNTLLNYI